jgi:hypothetical protein
LHFPLPDASPLEADHSYLFPYNYAIDKTFLLILRFLLEAFFSAACRAPVEKLLLRAKAPVKYPVVSELLVPGLLSTPIRRAQATDFCHQSLIQMTSESRTVIGKICTYFPGGRSFLRSTAAIFFKTRRDSSRTWHMFAKRDRMLSDEQ